MRRSSGVWITERLMVQQGEWVGKGDGPLAGASYHEAGAARVGRRWMSRELTKWVHEGRTTRQSSLLGSRVRFASQPMERA